MECHHNGGVYVGTEWFLYIVASLGFFIWWLMDGLPEKLIPRKTDRIYMNFYLKWHSAYILYMHIHILYLHICTCKTLHTFYKAVPMSCLGSRRMYIGALPLELMVSKNLETQSTFLPQSIYILSTLNTHSISRPPDMSYICRIRLRSKFKQLGV